MISLDVETVGLLSGETRESSSRAMVGFDATLREDGSGDPEAASRYLALSWPLARVVSVALTTGVREVVNLDGSLVDLPPEARILSEDGVLASLRAHDGEAALLEAVRQQLDHLATRPSLLPIVTFNGARFDLPLLAARMVAHRIKPAAAILQALQQKPWESGVHVDLMSRFGHGNPRGVGSLRAWAVGLLGIDPKTEGDGAHVGDLVARRDGLSLAKYNLGDARVTAALYRRWMEVMA